jgi:hypothetical protein
MIERALDVSDAWDQLSGLNIIKETRRKPLLHVPRYGTLGDRFAVYEANIAGTWVRVYQIKPFSELAYIIGFGLADGSVDNRYSGDRRIGSSLRLYQALETELEETLRREAVTVVEEFNRQHKELLKETYTSETTPIMTVYLKRDPKYPKRFARAPREEAEYFYHSVNITPIARLIVDFGGEIRFDTLTYLAKDLDLLGELLAGLWDGDGRVRAKDTHTDFSQSARNRLLVRFVANELLKHGIPISTTEEVVDIYCVDSFMVKKIKEKQPIVRVLKEGWRKWFELVGRRLQHPEKVEAAKEIARRAL